MWHAMKHKKVEVLLGQHSADAPAAWRAISDGTEDLLTSSVIGRLGYLEGSMAIELLLRAATPGPLSFVPVPEPVLSSDAWPALSLDDDAKVEPDWVLETASFTYIVEAKWGRGVTPCREQLVAQRDAATKAYSGRRLVHVVVVQSGDVVFPEGVPGIVVRWGDLRQAVLRALRENDRPHTRRVLEDMREALDRRGLDSVFLATLPGLNVRGMFGPWSTELPTGSRLLPPLSDDTIEAQALVDRWT